MDDTPIKEDLTITGTVNSGGLIGPVGGLSPKLEVAQDAGFQTVLIPVGERFVMQEEQTIDLVESSKDIGLDVIEVADIDEMIFHATGRENISRRSRSGN